MTVSGVLLAALALALAAACWTDLTARIIPNRLNAAVAIGAVPFWWAEGLAPWPDMGVRVIVAAVLFGLFLIPWFLRAMGGGDVKLIGALALWLTLPEAITMVTVTAFAGLVVSIAALAGHRLRPRAERPEVPYGVAIACGGLWVLAERYLYHFG